MAKAKTTKIKICPFIKAQCQKGKCEIYEPRLNRCTIPVLAYNLYRLSELESQRLELDSADQDPNELTEGAPSPINMNLNDLFQ